MFLLVQFLREEPFKDFATLDHCLEPDLNFLKKANLIIHVLLLDTSFLYQLVYRILNTLYLIIFRTHCNQVLVECRPLDDSFRSTKAYLGLIHGCASLWNFEGCSSSWPILHPSALRLFTGQTERTTTSVTALHRSWASFTATSLLLCIRIEHAFIVLEAVLAALPGDL